MISSWLVSKESGEAGQEDESDEMDLGCNYMPVDKSFSSSLLCKSCQECSTTWRGHLRYL